MVRLPINVLPTSGQLFPIIFFFPISIDQLDKTDAPLIPEAYINLLGVKYPVSLILQRPQGVYCSSTTPSQSKKPPMG
jgi:hypothetical protein